MSALDGQTRRTRPACVRAHTLGRVTAAHRPASDCLLNDDSPLLEVLPVLRIPVLRVPVLRVPVLSVTACQARHGAAVHAQRVSNPARKSKWFCRGTHDSETGEL